jgi:hypothetical protein
MLRVRQDQIDTFHEAMLRTFLERVARHLRAMFEEDLAALDDAALDAMLRRAVAKAAHYDIQIEADVARYAEYVVFLGEHFDDHANLPWAGAILRDASLSGSEKMNRIDTIVTEVFRPNEAEP